MSFRRVMSYSSIIVTSCALGLALQGCWSNTFALFVALPSALLAGVTAGLLVAEPPPEPRHRRHRLLEAKLALGFGLVVTALAASRVTDRFC